MTAQDLWLRVRALFLRRRVERELDDELLFHLEMQVRKNIAAGMSDDEAGRHARLHFGRPEEACRDERRINLIETLWQDARYSIRGFRQAPLFALAVIATIAVGLGVNTAVFTVFNAFVLRPYDVRDPKSLYSLYGRPELKLADLEDLRRLEMPFSDVIGSEYDTARVNGRQVVGELVTGNYFEALGVGPVLGRTLSPEDSRIGQPVAVLSYNAWKNWFGGDPDVLGKRLPVLGNPLIVGVARDGFGGLNEGVDDFWAPLGIPALRDEAGFNYPIEVIARLKLGVSKAQAQAGISLWASRVAGRSAWLRSHDTPIQMNANGLLGVSPILTAFGLVLVMACANVTNMMLARAMARQREIGIRLSLGAARARLIRQLLTESALLAMPAGLLGLTISRGLIEIAVRVVAGGAMRSLSMPADWRVVGFMMVAGVGSALLFGLLPAIQATRSSVVQAARGDFGQEFRPSRLRSSLVVVQITACVMLLITAGVILRGVGRISTLELRGEPRDSLHIDVSEKGRRAVLSQLAADPMVRVIAGYQRRPAVSVALTESSQSAAVNHIRASAGYLTILGTPVSRGRDFTPEDASSDAAVAIVTSALEQHLWPHEDGLGRLIEIIQTDGSRFVTLIGIISSQNDPLELESIYTPVDPTEKDTQLLVSTAGDAENARQRIDDNLAALAPGGVRQMFSLQTIRSQRRVYLRVFGWTAFGLALLALVLTVSGVYGVLAFLVAQRKKEIGIRMALGASARGVVGMVMNQSLRLTVVGLAVGMPIAVGIGRIINAFEPDMDEFFKTYDPVVYLGAATVALAACIAASYIPSRRAAMVDPAITLRHD